ncbi:hypothetical protein LJC27_07725, partial [Christensenellaceae bacterium OttesenSCG-928-M15]|nr:hypothetical protein [Christensenellaceae bacterium OttesenSCG-928-M15]
RMVSFLSVVEVSRVRRRNSIETIVASFAESKSFGAHGVEQHMERYRSGHNELHSKCGSVKLRGLPQNLDIQGFLRG